MYIIFSAWINYIQKYIFMNPFSYMKIITKIFKTLSICSISLKSYDIIDIFVD